MERMQEICGGLVGENMCELVRWRGAICEYRAAYENVERPVSR